MTAATVTQDGATFTQAAATVYITQPASTIISTVTSVVTVTQVASTVTVFSTLTMTALSVSFSNLPGNTSKLSLTTNRARKIHSRDIQ